MHQLDNCPPSKSLECCWQVLLLLLSYRACLTIEEACMPSGLQKTGLQHLLLLHAPNLAGPL